MKGLNSSSKPDVPGLSLLQYAEVVLSPRHLVYGTYLALQRTFPAFNLIFFLSLESLAFGEGVRFGGLVMDWTLNCRFFTSDLASLQEV